MINLTPNQLAFPASFVLLVCMDYDPNALKMWIDGSAFKNPGTDNGLAGIVQYPDFVSKGPEHIFTEAYEESNISRMELLACIKALEYVCKNYRNWKDTGIHRIQIFTDSKYIYDNKNRATRWRKDKWRGTNGQPIENKDLWQRFLSVWGRAPAEIIWHPGKTNELNRLVDQLAKKAAKSFVKVKDFGFSRGKISRSKSGRGVATPYPNTRDSAIIHIYRYATKNVTMKERKIWFTVFNETDETWSENHYAYWRGDLPSRKRYKVKFGTNSKYPTIEEMEIEEAV